MTSTHMDKSWNGRKINLNIPRRLKLWRQRRAKESGIAAFTQRMAAIELKIPLGTYIGYEQGHRTPSSPAYQYLLEKTEDGSKRFSS